MPPDKPRVLFVDDEQALLDGLRAGLYKQRKCWEMLFVCGGEEALRVLGESRVQVVVSDLRMPGMDGATFLTHVAEHQPSAVRIVLSGEAEEETATRAIAVSHQWLSKPCDRGDLVRAIERGLESLDLLDTAELSCIPRDIGKLAAAPRCYIELRKLLDVPGASMDDVGKLIGSDPALGARVLQMVNSSLFGAPAPVPEVGLAVRYLGIDHLASILLADSMFTRMPGGSERVQQEHLRLCSRSKATGELMSRLLDGEACRVSGATAGLLSEVGRLAMLCGEPEHWLELVDVPGEGSDPLHHAETDRFGSHQGVWAEALLFGAGLPPELVEPIVHQYEPRRSGGTAGLAEPALHVAGHLMDLEWETTRAARRLDLAACAEQGFEPDLEQAREWASELRKSASDCGEAAA